MSTNGWYVLAVCHWRCVLRRMRVINTNMHTYAAMVKVHVNGFSRSVRTEVRAASSEDARWILWALYGFHSILVGPSSVH